MARLTDRLTKLENSLGGARYCPPVAVLSTRLPPEDGEQAWMQPMLWEHGWYAWPGDCMLGLSVVTIDGEPAVLVPPTAFSDLTPAQAQIFDQAKNSFPRIEVSHFCGSWGWTRHNDRAEYERRKQEADPFIRELCHSIGLEY